ncbi:MAG: bifunctional alpha,alpha-trehalose-phosphate synthase (UDP-forming)/trehalose-phosphatase [Bacteroidetes bacterium GWE2_39_28]|nr:MAG: bifunctional alpha,alpha-trehalose-phosphate synthase (UDP-forming)/trehalose-phosphatase [Bacteroidetes bacterium GWE2_39_28]OFY12200.1 MAG: bifunctional alpha,alpha-trehalose-phosphate synthase (UDP-forming)/trehalose-phosphatase [Bacteroidetes bacterium GWF2_39_10]OFZ08969.1 MAG: bifunctional alpha,alpha-trehalose-phosphate synthase (UDP-forming)/trehalose-phosphatase [Bacteroidetes bacterium RIFOXYB2_FULL_39_7]OFZ12322.1 MAG: bifunctional alpha,alpha-trehalose-phosphate synthase (UDP
MKLIIISNRLPVKAIKTKGSFRFTRSEGGLTTGLDSLNTDIERHWIGWPGVDAKNEEEKEIITQHLLEKNFHPVFLSKKDIKEYYEGYSNSKIWPLCHYFFTLIQHESSHWDSYKMVNRLFAKAAEKIMEPGDIVWVQDYQLMLLPRMLRDINPEVSIGYFHHIPFPSYELFRVLPERAQLLTGLLGADLIAFHTYEYMRHFISAAERVLDLSFDLDEVRLRERIVRVDALPMGINYDLYYDSILNPKVARIAHKLKKDYRDHKIILSVDRLDYSKGILHRLKGFAQFLENNPEFWNKVSLFMIIVPSRDNVESYSGLKTKIDETIGSINGIYSNMNWTPVHYFYHGFSFEELCAMYHVADIALVTPLRDGMNLVAKEYIAAKRNANGVLILSEMAGASIELIDALIINPNDSTQIEEAILKALKMPESEQQERMKWMQKRVSKQTVNKWAGDFIRDLKSIRERNTALFSKVLSIEYEEEIRIAYDNTKQRLIILDYDGTLSPFMPKPEDAAPSEEILETLRLLSSDKRNRVVISSGRDHNTLETWLGGLDIGLAAEHGAFFKEGSDWTKNSPPKEWEDEILQVMQQFVEKTPRSSLEVKETALVWHYRKVDAWLASIRVPQLIQALITPCTREHLQIMKGNKIVEIKYPEFTKGSEVNRLLKDKYYDFILAMGDDVTDEDMFNALPVGSYTIKIGTLSDSARFNLLNQTDTLPFLRRLAGRD